MAEWYMTNFQKNCIEEIGHYTPILDSKHYKLRLPFNFNFEGDKELSDQNHFLSHDKTTNNNVPTHFKEKESHVVSVL